ncbi:hypothetical protein HDV06_006587 [Boothiomyces sp. JEL0866]|nr:hypothetical protein HDV06_006587 [Boothiomyces sp. JEL0866]
MNFYNVLLLSFALASDPVCQVSKRGLEKRCTFPNIKSPPEPKSKPPPSTSNGDSTGDKLNQCITQLKSQPIVKSIISGKLTAPDANSKNSDVDVCKKLPNKPSKRQVANQIASIPLVSKFPGANPYHEDLTGMDPSSILIRRGWGTGVKAKFMGPDGQSHTGVNCDSSDPNSIKGCSYQIAYDVTVSNTNAVSISQGSDLLTSISDSNSWGTSDTNGKTKTISDSLEKAVQRSKTHETGTMNATDIQKAVTDTHTDEVMHAHTSSDDVQITDTSTWDHQDSDSHTEDSGTDTQTHTGSDSTTTLGSGSNNKMDNSLTNGVDISCDIQHSDSNTLSFQEGVKAQILDWLGASFTTDQGTTKTDGQTTVFTWHISMTNTVSQGTDTRCDVGTTTFNDVTSIQHNNNGHTWDSNGGSHGVMNGHSESDTDQKSHSDSISNTLTTGNTYQSSASDSSTNMYGTTRGHSISLDESYSATTNRNKDVTLLNSTTYTFNRDISNSTTNSMTFSSAATYDLNPGACGNIVCRPIVKSMLIPYAVPVDENNVDLIVAELQTIDNPGNVTCFTYLQDCRQATLPAFEPFKDHRDPFGADNLHVDQVISYDITCEGSSGTTAKNCNPIILQSGAFKLKFYVPTQYPGKIGIGLFHYDQMQWSTGVLSSQMASLTVNQQGQVVHSAKNFYGNLNATSTMDVIWKSVPSNLNYTIGLSTPTTGYRLNLFVDGDYGELRLLDGYDIMIWSSNQICKHSFGYKYPVDSLFPAHPTEVTFPNEPGQIDPHNTGVSTVTNVQSYLSSDCSTILHSNDILVDYNDQSHRFYLYLTPNGNLVYYDSFRILWQSSTANLWYAKGPYRLVVDTSGELHIKDSQDMLIWSNIFGSPDLYYYAIDTLTGYFHGYDSSGQVIWTLQQAELAGVMKYYINPVQHCDQCSSCSYDVSPKYLLQLATNTIFQSPMIYHGYQFYSSSGSNLVLNGTSSHFGDIRWLMYNDGFVTRIDRANECIGFNKTDLAIIPCTSKQLRVDKLWGFVGSLTDKQNITDINTRGNRFMMMGHRLVDATPGYSSMTMDKNGVLIIKRSIGFPSYIPTNRVLSEPPMLTLTKTGRLSITNLYENVTFANLVDLQNPNDAPYSLQLNKGVLTMLNSKNIAVWKH